MYFANIFTKRKDVNEKSPIGHNPMKFQSLLNRCQIQKYFPPRFFISQTLQRQSSCWNIPLDMSPFCSKDIQMVRSLSRMVYCRFCVLISSEKGIWNKVGQTQDNWINFRKVVFRLSSIYWIEVITYAWYCYDRVSCVQIEILKCFNY